MQSHHVVYNRKAVLTDFQQKKAIEQDYPSASYFKQPEVQPPQPKIPSQNLSNTYQEKLLQSYQKRAGNTSNWEPKVEPNQVYEEQNYRQPEVPQNYQQEAKENDTNDIDALYAQEIELLREQLRQKEQEVKSYQQPPSVSYAPTQDQQSYIEKPQYAYQIPNYSSKKEPSELDFQITARQQIRQAELAVKQREQDKRLEDLQRLREVELYEKLEKAKKAREYKENLEIQELLKNQISQKNALYPSRSMAETGLSPAYSHSNIQTEAMQKALYEAESLYATSFPRYTKKSPKPYIFNPITGLLKDTSRFVPEFSSPFLQQAPAMYASAFNGQSKLAPELAGPYMSKNPSAEPTPDNSVSYKPDYRETAKYVSDERQRSMSQNEKNLADYGSMVLRR